MKWFKRKYNKLNQTTRLYSLYGESANLKYLEDKIKNFQPADVNKAYVDNQDNNLSRKINANTASIGNNVNSIVRLQNRLDNLPTIDTSKFTTKDYVDRQDGLLRSDIAITQGNANTNKVEIKKTNDKLQTLTDRVVDLALEHNKFANKDKSNTFNEQTFFRKNVNIDTDATVGGTFSTNVFNTLSTANVGGKLFLRQGGSVFSSHITEGNSIVNKSYVDGLRKEMFGATRTWNTGQTGFNLKINKSDFISGLYEYTIYIPRDAMKSIIDRVWGSNHLGRKFMVQLNTITATGKTSKAILERPNITRFYEFGNVQIHGNINSDIYIRVVSKNDIWPGSVGLFYDNDCRIDVYITEILL